MGHTEVLSPFLQGTNIQYAFDSTSLGYLKTCPRLYQYTMIEGWSAKDESIHLRFGQEYHKALQDFDEFRCEGADFEGAVRGTVQLLLERVHNWKPDLNIKAGKYKNPESLVRSIVWYLDHYRNDAAKTFVLANGKPAVELSFRFELDWGPKSQSIAAEDGMPMPGGITRVKERQSYMLSGHLDRVVTFSDHLFVMDRKTTTYTLGDYYYAQFEPNNQMTLYTLASQVVIGAPVKGVIIDAAQLLVDSVKFGRSFTYRTADQLQEWTDDLRFWFAQAEAYAEADHWPMNDTACDKYGGCRFRDVCSRSPQVRDKMLAGKFTKLEPSERWNPLKPRTQEAA